MYVESESFIDSIELIQCIRFYLQINFIDKCCTIRRQKQMQHSKIYAKFFRNKITLISIDWKKKTMWSNL